MRKLSYMHGPYVSSVSVSLMLSSSYTIRARYITCSPYRSVLFYMHSIWDLHIPTYAVCIFIWLYISIKNPFKLRLRSMSCSSWRSPGDLSHSMNCIVATLWDRPRLWQNPHFIVYRESKRMNKTSMEIIIFSRFKGTFDRELCLLYRAFNYAIKSFCQWDSFRR